ncbi:MAG: hypothetical protein H7101_04045 [Deinococcales bacterium]|nr:hypothetical protein [Chitinophagaceae bacterium]
MIEKDIYIVNELMELSPALISTRVDTSLIFSIPKNYFNNLSTTILNAVAAENLQQSAIPYQAPADYFSNLSNNILIKIDNEKTVVSAVDSELQVIAPLLITINKANVFSVPNGYFNNLQIEGKLQNPPAKIVPITNTNIWIKYAIVACVVGVIVTSAYFFTNKKDSIDYAAYKKIDIVNSISTLSSDELVNYLDTANTITNHEVVNLLDVKIPETQEHIKNISDEDLKQYLKEVNLPVTDIQEEI